MVELSRQKLTKAGVDALAAIGFAESVKPARINDVLKWAEEKAQINKGGLIRDALVKGWNVAPPPQKANKPAEPLNLAQKLYVWSELDRQTQIQVAKYAWRREATGMLNEAQKEELIGVKVGNAVTQLTIDMLYFDYTELKRAKKLT